MAGPAPTQAPAAAPAGGGGFLARKVGPLPMWGWLAILTAVALGFYLYEKHKSGASSTPAEGDAQVPEVVVNDTTQAATPPPEPTPPTPPTPPVISVPPDKKAPLPKKKKKEKRPVKHKKPDTDKKAAPDSTHPATRHPLAA
jgi:outer membrane biosynthesis protein TonB